jgi:hypothetical protein
MTAEPTLSMLATPFRFMKESYSVEKNVLGKGHFAVGEVSPQAH